jgi:Fe-S cluster assembly iron-binding protein IscA
MIKLDPSACETIKKELSEKGLPLSVRIEIRSSDCCDPSLGLALDKQREADLVEMVDCLTVVMSPEVYALVGEVAVSYVDDSERKGFIITSEKALHEWQGFAACEIRRE